MTFRRIWRKMKDGGYWAYELDGVAVKSVTGILREGIPKPALMDWAARMAGEWAADNLYVLTQMDREAAVSAIKDAHNRSREAAGAKGHVVHGLAEQLADGAEVEVPPELGGYVDAYVRYLEDWQPETIAVEGAVASRRWAYGGTFDWLGRLRGELCLVDIKTGGSGVWPETCLQLAAYRSAEVMLDVAGREVAMPATAHGLALWLADDGTYELLPVESGPEMFAVFLHAAHVASFAGRKRDTVIGLPWAAYAPT